MAPLRAILKSLKLFILESIYTRKLNINNEKAIFSFTFDDVPLSAATNGASILESCGATGTYYVASGIDDPDADEPFLSAEEVRMLHERGHDIGCHTFSHLNLRKHSSEKILSDCNTNTEALRNIIGIKSIDHFAYPFGMVSLQGKSKLGRKYATLRTTDSGINHGMTDLTHLRAISLCDNTFNKDDILKIIKDAEKDNGWVIFYSHDIRNNPGEWGTKTDDFSWVVQQCAKSSGEILNVSQAYKKITSSHKE